MIITGAHCVLRGTLEKDEHMTQPLKDLCDIMVNAI